VTTYLASGFLVMCLLLAVLYDDDAGVPTSATERIMDSQGSPLTTPAPFDVAPMGDEGADADEPASALPQ